MGKRLLVFAIIFVSLFAFTLWRAQPPFRPQRKLLAKLPYVPETLLVTDLDDDGHPEVIAIRSDKPPIWVRFPFDKPSRLPFENYRAIKGLDSSSILKALPILTTDNRLRLLGWKEGRAALEPLPSFPDIPLVDDAFALRGRSIGKVFLQVYRGNNCWSFTLTPQGKWQFASHFASRRIEFRKFGLWCIADLADFDRDGLLDALCIQWHPGEDAWVFWGGQKERETDLGVWMCYGFPQVLQVVQVVDLDGDGWMEIVMVAKDKRLKIWRFDRRERGLKVVAASSPLPILVNLFSLDFFDLDGDGWKEIVVTDFDRNCWVFQWRDGKLKMWQGKINFRGDVWIRGLKQVKFGNQLAFYSHELHFVWLFPPQIWWEEGKLRWQFRDYVQFTFFYLLPKGKQALSPSNWHIQKAPFDLRFAVDIDGDGSDEVVGYDDKWRRWRLYRAEVTKTGELRWRDVLLGREKPRPREFALLVDGKRRGLVVAWSDGRLELLTMEGRR